jgi:hypothetical protein
VDLRRLVRIAGFAGGIFAALGFLASLGRGPLPPLGAEWAGPFHALVAVVGLAAALAAARRSDEIERERFAYATDPHTTRSEKELAHKEAERAIRLAHTALAAAPIALGYWLAYELPQGVTGWGRAQAGSAMIGYGLGMLFDRLRRG